MNDVINVLRGLAERLRMRYYMSEPIRADEVLAFIADAIEEELADLTPTPPAPQITVELIPLPGVVKG